MCLLVQRVREKTWGVAWSGYLIGTFITWPGVKVHTSKTSHVKKYSLCLRARSQDENGSCVGEQFLVSCALIHTLNPVCRTKIYLWSSCDARLMDARVMDFVGFYFRWGFMSIHPSWPNLVANLDCFSTCNKFRVLVSHDKIKSGKSTDKNIYCVESNV